MSLMVNEDSVNQILNAFCLFLLVLQCSEPPSQLESIHFSLEFNARKDNYSMVQGERQ